MYVIATCVQLSQLMHGHHVSVNHCITKVNTCIVSADGAPLDVVGQSIVTLQLYIRR